MSNNIFIGIVGLLIALLAVVGLYALYEGDSAKSCEIDIKIYQEEITQLKQASEEQAERYEQAQEQATTKMQKVQDDAKLILDAKIPTGCDQAIEWGLNEGHSFS